MWRIPTSIWAENANCLILQWDSSPTNQQKRPKSPLQLARPLEAQVSLGNETEFSTGRAGPIYITAVLCVPVPGCICTKPCLTQKDENESKRSMCSLSPVVPNFRIKQHEKKHDELPRRTTSQVHTHKPSLHTSHGHLLWNIMQWVLHSKSQYY